MKFSIIIPVYNVEKYLKASLNSVNSQSYKNYEVIIVNDGSTDNSEHIIDLFIKKNKRFKKINIKNAGQGYARNIGVQQASGDFLIFLDSDDYLNLNLLDSLNTYISRQHQLVDIVVYDYLDFENTPSNEIRKHIFPDNLRKYAVVPWNKAYRLQFWLKHGFKFPEGISYEDTPLVHTVMGVSNYNIKLPNIIGYYYRQNRSDSTIGQSQNGDILMRLTALKIMLEYIKKYDKYLKENEKLNIVYMKLGQELIYLFIMAKKNRETKKNIYEILCLLFSKKVQRATFKYGGLKSKAGILGVLVYFILNYKIMPKDRKKYV